jgi:hypothetical protein
MKIVFAAKDGFEYNRVKVLRAGLESLPNCEVILFKLPERNKITGQQLLKLSKDADAVYVPLFVTEICVLCANTVLLPSFLTH